MNKKLTIDNNPVANRKRYYWILERRKRRLRRIASLGSIERDENGMATAFYPNLDPRSDKAKEIIVKIRNKQREIERWIHQYGYNLA